MGPQYLGTSPLLPLACRTAQTFPMTLPLAISAPCAGPPHPATVTVRAARALLALPYGVPKELATTVATSRQLSTEQMRKVEHHMWEIQPLLCYTSSAATAHTSFQAVGEVSNMWRYAARSCTNAAS